MIPASSEAAGALLDIQQERRQAARTGFSRSGIKLDRKKSRRWMKIEPNGQARGREPEVSRIDRPTSCACRSLAFTRTTTAGSPSRTLSAAWPSSRDRGRVGRP